MKERGMVRKEGNWLHEFIYKTDRVQEMKDRVFQSVPLTLLIQKSKDTSPCNYDPDFMI